MSFDATVREREQRDASVEWVGWVDWENKTKPQTTGVPRLRSWSKNADKNNSTVFTLKCTYDDLPSSSRPHVIVDIDSRECLQRVVNTVMFYFQRDNMHLFECRLPARGSIKDGTGNLWFESFGIDFGLAVKWGNVSSNPNDHDRGMRNHIQRKLDKAGMKWSDIDRAREETDAVGKWRNLMGHAFDPSPANSQYNLDLDDLAPGGHFSLEELALQKGDSIELTYDLGARDEFSIIVEEVKTGHPLLQELNMVGHATRAKLVNKSKANIPNQYNHTG